MQVLGHRERLDVRVVVVSFASVESLRRYRDRFGLGAALLLSDAERAAYEAFGFGRATRARVWLDPRVWWRYGELVLRGRRLERVEDDVLQLGGDVLADPGGRIVWVHRSRGPEDRPTVDQLMSARHAS